MWKKIKDWFKRNSHWIIPIITAGISLLFGGLMVGLQKRKYRAGAYRYDRDANSGGTVAEQYLWDRTSGGIQDALDILREAAESADDDGGKQS